MAAARFATHTPKKTVGSACTTSSLAVPVRLATSASNTPKASGLPSWTATTMWILAILSCPTNQGLTCMHGIGSHPKAIWGRISRRPSWKVIRIGAFFATHCTIFPSERCGASSSKRQFSMPMESGSTSVSTSAKTPCSCSTVILVATPLKSWTVRVIGMTAARIGKRSTSFHGKKLSLALMYSWINTITFLLRRRVCLP